MGIGQDITDVVGELGMQVHILERESGIITERIDYESNSQMVKPFSAETFLNTTFTHTSAVTVGDLIQAPAMGNHYRVMNVFPEVFENEIIYKSCVLYKCNTVATVYAPVEKRDPATMRVANTWEVRGNPGVICLIADKLYGSRLDDETQEVFQMDIKGRILYFPKKFAVQAKDRVVVNTSTVPYEVTSIEDHTFPGMSLVYLEEDTRKALYPEAPISLKLP